MFNLNNFRIILDFILIALLLYASIKFMIFKGNSLLFIGNKFYFFIIIILTNLLLSLFNQGFLVPFVWPIIYIISAFRDMMFLSLTSNSIRGLFFNCKFSDIDRISIENYPDIYTKTMLVTITLKNKSKHTCKFLPTESLITALENTNLPLENTYRKVEEL